MKPSPASNTTVVYRMVRDDKIPAEVCVFANGRCVVNWRTSVIVYESEAEARAVHIDHMGGRGEKTRFDLVWSSSESFTRGNHDAFHDSTEGCVFGSIGAKVGGECPPWMSWFAPDWIDGAAERLAYLHGYASRRWPKE